MATANRLPIVLLTCSVSVASLAKAAPEEPSPLEPRFSQCYIQDSLTVCRQQSDAASAMLKINYSGRLSKAGYPQISSWIKLNGRTGIFRMEHDRSGETLRISNGALICTLCSTDSDSSTVACPLREMATKWLCTEAPREMKDMFFWAISEGGTLNAWDIELAFVSGNDWDSQYGQNYRFRLE